MKEHFERKVFSREEINIIVAEQLGQGVEPICKEIGVVLEGLNLRVRDLEQANNAIIEEMKKWKSLNPTLLN